MSVGNLVALLVLIAGHTELWVTLVNRVHARPISPDFLQRIRHIHDMIIPSFAVAVITGLGLAGPQLLLGGSWSDVHPVWYLPLLASGVGAIGGLFAIGRYHWLSRCPIQIGITSEVTEIKSANGQRPLGHGHFERLAKTPRNEQFSVDLSRKVFRLPHLPSNFSGLKILHLSDWHFEGTITHDYFEQVSSIAARESVDLVAFTGDLLDNNDCLDWLPTTLGKLAAPLGCWFILGNHDWYLDEMAARQRLASLGWKDATTGTHSIPWRGGHLWLAGDETPWMGTPPTFPPKLQPLPLRRVGPAALGADSPFKNVEISETTTPEFRILLSHTPDNLPRAKQLGVDLMLSGHTHGGQVILPLIGPVFSPSRFGCRYASGSFWESPTLLHVSRGLSGRHPLRWRCRPEITVIEIAAIAEPE